MKDSAFESRIVSWYNFGALLLFLGLLWTFLPHAAHEVLVQELEKEGESHITHMLQGIGIALAGLALMVMANRKK